MDKDGLTGELLARKYINLDYAYLLFQVRTFTQPAHATPVIAHVLTICDLFAVPTLTALSL